MNSTVARVLRVNLRNRSAKVALALPQQSCGIGIEALAVGRVSSRVRGLVQGGYAFFFTTKPMSTKRWSNLALRSIVLM